MAEKKMGRPPKANPITKVVSFKCDAVSLELLDAYCEERKVTRGAALRHGVHLLFKEEANK